MIEQGPFFILHLSFLIFHLPPAFLILGFTKEKEVFMKSTDMTWAPLAAF